MPITESETPRSLEGTSQRFSFTRGSWDTDKESAVPASRAALGGKGFGLWEMTRLGLPVGLPVPPWFTISADTGRVFLADNTLSPKVYTEAQKQTRNLEEKTGRRFGDPKHPLFVSVRSGAEISMPGAMKTILNIGLNDTTVRPLAGQIGEHAAWVAYYHLVKQYATDVCHVDMSPIEALKDGAKAVLGLERINQLPVLFLRPLVEMTKTRLALLYKEFPQDPKEQLERAIHEVFASWNSTEAAAYRKHFGISEYLGTAVTIQQMAWGNSEGNGSGSGVLMTRNPQTLGEAVVGFLPHIQGNAVVGDKAHPEMFIRELPVSDSAKQELHRWKEILESYHGLPRDIEFTIEVDASGSEHVYILQDRQESLTSPAEILWLLEQMREEKMTEQEAMRRATGRMLHSVLTYDLDPVAMEKARQNDLVATGQPIANGHACGPVVFSIDEAKKQPLLDVILMTPKKVKVDLVALPKNVRGFFTYGGGIGAHSGRIAARMERPVIFDGRLLQKVEIGQTVTLNGTTGEVFRGMIPLAEKPGSSLFTAQQLEKATTWDTQRKQNPWRLFVPPQEEITITRFADETTRILNAQHRYQSRKATIEAAFVAAIPAEIRMHYEIKHATDIEGIKRRVGEILAAGFDATLRTGHFPDVAGGKGPWVSLTNSAEVEEFFTNPYFPSKYGGYHVWIAHPRLTEILVGQIPKDKLHSSPEIARQHCAWTLSATQNNELIIQVHPHSPHLRALDEEDADKFITYTIPIDTKTGRLADMVVPEIGELLKNDPLAMRLAQLVQHTLRSWYPQYLIPHRLAALATLFPHTDNYAPPALQGQARMYPDGKSWVLSYDLNLDRFDQKNGKKTMNNHPSSLANAPLRWS